VQPIALLFSSLFLVAQFVTVAAATTAGSFFDVRATRMKRRK
jgi:hypothetical protein